MSETRLIVGLMSGTSADGVDAAAVEVTGRGDAMTCVVRGHAHEPYPPELRRRVFALRGAAHPPAEHAALTRAVTLAHAAAARPLMGHRPVAVAAHGQTVFHAPPLTTQLLDPALLAAELGVDVVSDFRRADLAAGGQGAPLVPFADWLRFRSGTEDRVLLNLGGVANLTFLPAGGGLGDVRAFDCGPANCLSDWLMREHGDTPHDDGGKLAATGEVLQLRQPRHCVPPVGTRVLTETQAARPAARSAAAAYDGAALDIDQLIAGFADGLPDAPLADLLATANQVAADGVLAHAREATLIVSGGGVNNADLMRRITAGWPGAVEVDPEWQSREAAAFALLAAATLDREPANVPAATGATRRVVLGAVTPTP